MSKPSHITDRASDALEDAAESAGLTENVVPGPSPNPATNLIIHDIVLRSVGRVARLTVEKALLGKRYGSQFAKEAVENRSVVHTLAAYGVTKFATRSLPGFALVSGGLLVKTLFDRSQGKRKARKAGDATLQEQSKPDGKL
ncbi:hypothetical protein [Erythrobacter alti]|uniref:hypothetical protein n=1 Tax=Erythrobacter alti TaxID=1896145 RepID=UPI0030F42F57